MEFTLKELQVLLRGIESKYSKEIADPHPPLTSEEIEVAASLYDKLKQEYKDTLFEENN